MTRMSSRKTKVKCMNTKKIADLALQQLDNVGFQLRAHGITDKVNRHDIVAFAMAQQNRFKGEMTRLELHVGMQKARIQKAREDAEALVEKLVSYLPEPLAEPANKIKARVFQF